MRTSSKTIAFGGIMAALAVVVMCMGGLIPMATYVCPVLCMVILQLVRKSCGNRIAWSWYGAVAILSVLMAPDKEAAAVFLFLGYYPIVKPWLDQKKGKWLLKGIFFNCVILLMYWLLIHLFGMAEIASEFAEVGIAMTIITLVLGNVTFFLVDILLGRRLRFRRA